MAPEAGGSPPSVGGSFYGLFELVYSATSTPTHGVGFQGLGRLNFGDIGGKRGPERPLPPLDGP